MRKSFRYLTPKASARIFISPSLIVFTLGRCADYILKERPDLLTVFLHADIDYRKNAVIEKYGIDEKSALKEIKATDKKRARFHNFYSDEKWGEADTYDLCINVAKIGIDKTVDLIEEYIKSRYS